MIVGDQCPVIDVTTLSGDSNTEELLGRGWGVLFSFPEAFDAVCLTEMGEVARLKQEWDDRSVKVVGLVCAPVGSVQGFVVDIKTATGFQVNFPVICDESNEVAQKLELVKEASAFMRGVTFVNEELKVAMTMNYPASCGMNFHEILRIIDSLSLTKKHEVFTPVNWVRGQDTIVGADVDERKADNVHDSIQRIDLPSQKGYLRVVHDPSSV